MFADKILKVAYFFSSKKIIDQDYNVTRCIHIASTHPVDLKICGGGGVVFQQSSIAKINFLYVYINYQKYLTLTHTHKKSF